MDHAVPRHRQTAGRAAHDRRLGLCQAAGHPLGANAIRSHLDQGPLRRQGEGRCLLKWEPGATLPMHRHPEIEQTYVVEGSFYDHDGICRAGEFVWRRVGSFHETHSDEGAVILAVYRKPNVFQQAPDMRAIVMGDQKENSDVSL
jgi:hypothetical protein